MSARILVVEDEEALTTLLRYNLDAEGYDVETVGRGDDADTRLKERVPDLIVLDWMLPGLSGIELCRRLRARPETRQLPIIMLTARGEESERVRGLATGADDYIVKPFSVPELLARVKGLLRRASPERLATVLTYGDIELDREKRRVARSGRPIDLGPTEYRLLEFFLEHPGRVFSREQLLDSVWGRDIYIDERTVDVHIGRLRKLLNPGREQDQIRTVRGAGYADTDAGDRHRLADREVVRGVGRDGDDVARLGGAVRQGDGSEAHRRGTAARGRQAGGRVGVGASTVITGQQCCRVIASEAKQSIAPHGDRWIASSLALPCANASRLSQAMTRSYLVGFDG